MLENVVPAGCGLIDVKVENGIAKLDFTSEFVNLVQNSDGEIQHIPAKQVLAEQAMSL